MSNETKQPTSKRVAQWRKAGSFAYGGDNSVTVSSDTRTAYIAGYICAMTEQLNSPAPEQPDDGSDWFYKLKFICRVLGGDPPAQDKATALGMARVLLKEKHSANIVQPITAPLQMLSEAELAAAYVANEGNGFKFEVELQQAFCDKNGLTLEASK